MTICPHTLNYHSDVGIAPPNNGDVLTWDGVAEAWIPAPSGGGLSPHALSFHSDCDTTGAVTNQVLTYNGSIWVPQSIPGAGPLALNDLTDVTAPSPAINDILQYNGANWVSVAVPPVASHTLNFHSDVNAPSPSNGQVLTYNSGAGNWQAQTPTPINLNDIANVNAPSPSSGQFLTWNGAAWVPGTPSGLSPHTLNFHSDVSVPSPGVGHVLTWNGIAWGSAPVSTVDELDDLSDVSITSPSTGELLEYDGVSWINSTGAVKGNTENGLGILRGSIIRAAGASSWAVDSGSGFTVGSSGGGANITISFNTPFSAPPTVTLAASAAQVTNGPTTFSFLQPAVASTAVGSVGLTEQWHSNPGNIATSPGTTSGTPLRIYFTAVGPL